MIPSNHSIRLFLQAISAFLVSFLFAGTAATIHAADTQFINSQGLAAIINNNHAAAREKAVDDALRNAVEQAVGTIVTSHTMTERYQLIEDKILMQTSGYIRRYNVLSEKADGSLYRVHIQAEVVRQNLMNDLKAIGLLHVLAEKPKIMLIIEEKVAGLFGTNAWETIGQAESTMIEEFINSGFNVVDPQTVKANISKDQALKILAGNPQEAAAAGLKAGAQIVITGRAFSKNAGGRILNGRMQSLQGIVQVRAVQTDDAGIISARSGRASKAHIDEVQGGTYAIEAAGRSVAKQLITDILNKWKSQTYGQSRQITVMLTGLVSYRHLMFIKNFLEKEVQGVKAVQQRSFLSGSAELSLDYSGKASNIADELANRQFEGFRLEPLQVTQNQLDLKVVLD